MIFIAIINPDWQLVREIAMRRGRPDTEDQSRELVQGDAIPQATREVAALVELRPQPGDFGSARTASSTISRSTIRPIGIDFRCRFPLPDRGVERLVVT